MGKNPLAQENAKRGAAIFLQSCAYCYGKNADGGFGRPRWSELDFTMVTTTHIPIEVYLRSSYEPDAEYVDGVIEERPAGENDHSTWQGAICFWLGQHTHYLRYGSDQEST
jgi:hypothetical protein